MAHGVNILLLMIIFVIVISCFMEVEGLRPLNDKPVGGRYLILNSIFNRAHGGPSPGAGH